MENHEKWGIAFILLGILMFFVHFLRVLGTIFLVLGLAIYFFGEREKRIEEVRE